MALIVYNNLEGWTINRIKLQVNYHDCLLMCSYSLWLDNADVDANTETYVHWETIHPVYIAVLTNSFLANDPAIFMGSLDSPEHMVEHWKGYRTYEDGTTEEGDAQFNVFWFVPSDWHDVIVPNGNPF
jgi:hypothetical protein